MSRAATTLVPFFFLASRMGGGGTRVGVRSARTPAQLAEALRRERQQLKFSVALPRWAGTPEGLTINDTVVLNEQLGQLLSRGVPLVEALEVIAQTVAPQARAVIDKLRTEVSGGSSFSDACTKSGAFDVVTVAVYRAAERTGDLAGSAKELAVSARRLQGVANRAQTLAIYPAIVMGVSVIVALGMVTFILPRLAQQMADISEPPLVTRVLAAIGSFIADNLVLFGIAGAALVVVLYAARGVVFGTAWKLVRELPVLREVVLAQESARFFSVMSAMTRAGVPIADALGTSNQAIHHPVLRQQMDKLRTRLVEGGVLRTLIEEVVALPLATRKLLVAAERAGDLENAFATLATDMTDEVDRRSQRALAVLQPITIVIMFVIVGGLLLAILIPLLSMASNIQG